MFQPILLQASALSTTQAKSSVHQLEAILTTSKATISKREENRKERKINIRASVLEGQDHQILPLTQAANNQAQAHRAALSHQNFSREIVHTVMEVNTGSMMQTPQTHQT